jgi:steroid delta-isomerase-like uncharacterized protein
MSLQKNKELLKRLFEEVWNQGKLDVADELIAPEYTIKHDPGDAWEGKTIDHATYKERINMSRQVLPDQQFVIEEMVAEDGKVAVSWRFTGTQTGNLPAMPATNRKVNISGLTIYYFENDKITGHWQVFDKLGLLTQLGVQIGK